MGVSVHLKVVSLFLVQMLFHPKLQQGIMWYLLETISKEHPHTAFGNLRNRARNN